MRISSPQSTIARCSAASRFKWAAQAVSLRLPSWRPSTLTVFKSNGCVLFLSALTIHDNKCFEATLHNKRFIEEHKVKIGERVIIERSGDVIPKVLGPDMEVESSASAINSSSAAEQVDWDHCPCSLKTKLAREADRVDLFCVSPQCPVQVERRLVHFASRQGRPLHSFFC